MEDGDATLLRVERSPESLRNRTTDILRQAISDGFFSSGSRLVERELCNYTGVSRTIIRESLRHLEAEGFVSIVPNRGPVVSTLTRGQVEQIYQVREALEPLCAKLFAESASDDAMKELQDAHASMQALFDSGDVKSIARAARMLFEIIYTNCGNEFISEFLRRLTARVDYLREVSMSQKGRLPLSSKEMKDIVDAITARDGERAAELSLLHVRQAGATALKSFKERESQPAKSTSRPRGRPKKVG